MSKSNKADSTAKKPEHKDSVTNSAAAPVRAKSIQKNTKSDEANSLTDKEQELFTECEQDIQTNLRGAFVLGWCLEQIRDQKLYRETHKTFDLYCRKRWDFSKSHANRHIQAYLCEKHLAGLKSPDVYVPTKEAQIRYMTDLNPDQWVQVATKVKETVGDRHATAGDFGEARQQLFPKETPEPKAKKVGSDQSELVKDKTPRPIFDTNLVPLSVLKKMADDAYIACGTKTQDALRVIGKLQRHLDEWSSWQLKQQEVA